MRLVPIAARALPSLLALLLLFASADMAAADTPPTPTCFYEVAGVCDGTYGTPNSSSTQIVDVDETVTLSSGFDPSPPFGTPVNPNCGPGSEALCIYSNIAWKIATPTGLLQPPISIQSNTCGGESVTCKFIYQPRQIGNGGDYWQTFVAAYQHGSSTIISKRGWAVYARPRFRWVSAQATGAVDYKAGIAYAVRGGTNPSYASCVDVTTINATSSTAFDCQRATGTGSSGQNPAWKFALPSGGGSWDLIIDPVKRTESGPTQAVGRRWQSRSVAVANSDIEETVSHLALGTLNVAIDTGGSQIQVGTKRKIQLILTESGGTSALDNVNWQFDYLVKQIGSSSGIVVEGATFSGPSSSFTLAAGESTTATVSVRADSVGSATLVAKAHWRDPSFDEHSATSEPATLTAVTTPVPPPGGEGGGGVPKPPIPTAATATQVAGHVSDQPLTSYVVTWFAAPSCDASDATAHLIGTRAVLTGGAGEGDASLAPTPAPASGEAVFGYSTLGAVRSARSDCVIVAGGGSIGLPGDALPLVPKPKLKPKVPAKVKAGQRFSLTVNVGGGGAGTIAIRKGKRRIAGPVKVIHGSATLKLKLPQGRQQLTLVFTPAAGGPATTKPLTLNVGD